MSWSVVLFNSDEKIDSVERLDENQLIPTDFCLILSDDFNNVAGDGRCWEIKGDDYVIEYCQDDEEVSNKIFNLYGKNSIYAMIHFAKKPGFQIYDTGLETMIDLENPHIIMDTKNSITI